MWLSLFETSLSVFGKLISIAIGEELVRGYRGDMSADSTRM
jgi:hypothetical protein